MLSARKYNGYCRRTGGRDSYSQFVSAAAGIFINETAVLESLWMKEKTGGRLEDEASCKMCSCCLRRCTVCECGDREVTSYPLIDRPPNYRCVWARFPPGPVLPWHRCHLDAPLSDKNLNLLTISKGLLVGWCEKNPHSSHVWSSKPMRAVIGSMLRWRLI